MPVSFMEPGLKPADEIDHLVFLTAEERRKALGQWLREMWRRDNERFERALWDAVGDKDDVCTPS